ncbi:hypothetical protein AB4212_54220, partial [Streptomyces sp. 2MCAF27]
VLCRADGTPVLVVVRSACQDCAAEAADPEIAGWIDPATGAFTAGPPPQDAGPCAVDECASVTVLRLCDQTPGGECVPFLRHLVHDCTGQVTASTDTTADGVTPYAVVGEAGDCADCERCEPAPLCPQLLGLSGPETWAMPEGTESVSLQVACGPVIVTDCAGNATQINECGTALNWSAPPGSCSPSALCTPFTVQVLDGAAAYINFLGPCDQGDVS